MKIICNVDEYEVIFSTCTDTKYGLTPVICPFGQGECEECPGIQAFVEVEMENEIEQCPTDVQ